LKSQGQPKAQLQFFIHSPSRRQSLPAMTHVLQLGNSLMQRFIVSFGAD
jgi:hypothetical protein